MSKYTTEVRYICETYAGLDESKGYNSIDDILDASYNKVFDFDFPIFDEAYRPVLCKKILKHYYVREIGEETVGLWKLRLDARMNEIMPYYNNLYELVNEDVNLFDDTNLHKDGNKTDDTAKEGNRTDGAVKEGTKNTSNSVQRGIRNTETYNDTHNIDRDADNLQRNLYSDTPQGALTGVDEEKYLTDARKIRDIVDESVVDRHTGNVINDGTDNSEGVEDTGYSEHNTNTGEYAENINNTGEYAEHIYGKSGGLSYAELIVKYRDALINIDVMIINDLSDLFMNIW